MYFGNVSLACSIEITEVVSQAGIGTDTGFAGCRWVDMSVEGGEHTHRHTRFLVVGDVFTNAEELIVPPSR